MQIDYDGISSVCDEGRNSDYARIIANFTEEFGKEPPTHWEICHVCSGDGGHSRRLGVVDPDDWEPEEFEEYLAGRYDAVCERCHGSGKVREINEDALTDEQKTWLEETINYINESWAERRSEMMFGC